MLHFCRGLAFVVFRRPLWHIQVELQNVVELVARVQVAEPLCNARVLTRRALEADSRLGSLAASLDLFEVGGVADRPVVLFVVPLSDFLVLLELERRNHVVNDEILELELVREFVNGVEHVVAFTVKVLRYSLQLFLGMLELRVQLLQLFRLEVEFFLQRRKLSMHGCDVLLLLFETLLEFSLHAHLVF